MSVSTEASAGSGSPPRKPTLPKGLEIFNLYRDQTLNNNSHTAPSTERAANILSLPLAQRNWLAASRGPRQVGGYSSCCRCTRLFNTRCRCTRFRCCCTHLFNARCCCIRSCCYVPIPISCRFTALALIAPAALTRAAAVPAFAIVAPFLQHMMMYPLLLLLQPPLQQNSRCTRPCSYCSHSNTRCCHCSTRLFNSCSSCICSCYCNTFLLLLFSLFVVLSLLSSYCPAPATAAVVQPDS